MGGNDDRSVRWITVGDLESYLTAEDAEGFAEEVSEPRADRGPQAGSPLGVVDATGSFVI